MAGSTRKLKRQKGTGGARCGSIKSPLFVGGGRVFGPVPRDYSFKLNKKLKQLARRSALTYKAQAGAICVVEPISMDAPKTKSIVAMAEALKVADKKVLRGFAGFERQSSALVPQPPLRESHSGFERQYVRSDERFGAGDGRGCREYFEYNVSLNTRKKNGNYH